MSSSIPHGGGVPAPAYVASPWRAAGLLLLAAGGQVSWLRLLDPDPWRLGFGSPGYLTSGASRAALAVLAGQAVVLVLAARRYGKLWRANLRALGAGPLAALGLTLHLLAATAITSRPAFYPVHLALTSVCVGLCLLTLVAAAAEAASPPADRVVAWLEGGVEVRWWAAATAAVAAAVLSGVVFRRIPHVPDEVVYLFQAKYMAQGMIALPAPPVPAAFDVIYTLTDHGRWFGIFPPGWPALLAVGVRLGAPSLVNPLLTGGVVLMAHRWVVRLYGRRHANLVAWLLAVSPWLLYSGASLMSHTASVLAAIIVLEAVTRLATRPTALRTGIVGGVALGALTLIRPFEAVLVGTVIALWSCFALKRTVLSRAMLAFALSAGAMGVLMLLYNRALTGDPFLPPITAYFDRHFYAGSNRLGFGASVGNVGWGNDVLPGHSALEALINGSFNAHLVQLELFGWGCGSLLFLWSALRQGAWRRSGGGLVVAVLGTTVLGYGLYWYSGADLGPRYWSQALVPLAILSVAGVFRLETTDPRVAWTRLALLASLLGAPLVGTWRGVVKYHDYRGVTPAFIALSRACGFGNDVVLIRGALFSDYAPGFVLNPPRWTDPATLFLRDVGEEGLSRLRAAFPTRRFWIVAGSSLTGGVPRVVNPPLPPLEPIGHTSGPSGRPGSCIGVVSR